MNDNKSNTLCLFLGSFECEKRIDKSVTSVIDWHHEALPKDRFVYLYLTLMIDPFSCTPFGAQRMNLLILATIMLAILNLASLYDVLVTFVSDQVT